MTVMVERLILEDDRYRLFFICSCDNDDWLNFRILTANKERGKILRSRLSYSRKQKRLSEGKSTNNLREKNPEGFSEIYRLIETAIEKGLV